jgi:glutathione S-transferase
MDSNGIPKLLHFRVSHYNEKIRWALDFKKWPHRRETQIPGWHIPRAWWHTSQNKLPILFVGDKTLFDSSRILLELENLKPDPALFPENPAERRRALAIQAYFDDEVAPALRRLVWSEYLKHDDLCARMATDGYPNAVKYAWQASLSLMKPLFRSNMQVYESDIEKAKDLMPTYFDRLASEIQPSGFLVGDQFSVADLSAASIMTAIIRPPKYSYPLPEPWPEGLSALRHSVSNHVAYKWVVDIYERFRGKSYEIGE